MTRCIAAGLDPKSTREWLDRAEGRHYADALAGAAGLEHVGPLAFQARKLTDVFDDEPAVDPVRCIRREPGSATVNGERFIASVAHALTTPHLPAGAAGTERLQRVS